MLEFSFAFVQISCAEANFIMDNWAIAISDAENEWDRMVREFAEREEPQGAPYPLNELETAFSLKSQRQNYSRATSRHLGARGRGPNAGQS